jgi:hypothetical protein
VVAAEGLSVAGFGSDVQAIIRTGAASAQYFNAFINPLCASR